MKLWKIYQTESNGYDTYDSAVVAAETAEEARRTHPSGGLPTSWYDWASKPDLVQVIYIGEAVESVVAGVIVASYNAG